MQKLSVNQFSNSAAFAFGYSVSLEQSTICNTDTFKDNSPLIKAAIPSDAAFFIVSGPELDREKLLTNPNTMNKLNQFSGRGAYVQPYCKSVTLQSREVILSGSNYGDPGEAGGQGEYIDDTSEDY